MILLECRDLERFDELVIAIADRLLEAPEVNVGKWQSLDVSDRPEMVSFELPHVSLEIAIETTYQPKLAICTSANLPWAEDHFQERVSGKPLNPPPSEQWWPYAQQGNAAHKHGQQFSHTYPERFWPKYAGSPDWSEKYGWQVHHGIRYHYGDLQDIIDLLKQEPQTRQAYLPVWFPEDTGAVSGQRVPCTLGYHFLQRNGVMDITYYIRSCDFMRHWRDDVYMAGRLLQWVCSEVDAKPGKLQMHINSLHYFAGDRSTLENQAQGLIRKVNSAWSQRVASAL